jgi:hypothetical protein
MRTLVAANAAIDRPLLFFWLFLLAAGNKLIGIALAAIAQNGLADAAFDLFGISLILWVALGTGLRLVREADPEPVRTADLAVAAAVFAAAALPVPGLSAVALTIVAAYVIATSEAESNLRRGALIFLATTSTLIWGPTMLEVFSGPLLGADAYFVGQLAGVARTGNQVSFIDGSGAYVIVPGCSSFHSMSLALIFWTTINQWFRVPFSPISFGWAIAAMVATIAVNAGRLAALAWFPAYFDFIHAGWGGVMLSWTTLLLVAGICLYGARREVFATV